MLSQRSAAQAPNAASLLSRELDGAYRRASDLILRAVARSVSTGLVARRLDDLDAEAARVETAGTRLTGDNAFVMALLAALSAVMTSNRALVGAGVGEAMAAGVTAAQRLAPAMALMGLTAQQAGVTWRTPDAGVLERVIREPQDAALNDRLTRYETYVALVIAGILAQGGSPTTIAANVRLAVETLPGHYANQMLRTLQLAAYRQATALTQAANADIIAYQIRVAVLDHRTCAACWALHGTRLEVGEVVDDHPLGRCTAIAVLRGMEGTRTIERGADVFETLDETAQRGILGNAAYAAWVAGAVTLDDFVHRHDDALYGSMVTAASLRGILGDAAKAYYQRG